MLGNASTGPGSLGNAVCSGDIDATWGSFNSDDPYKIEVNITASAVPLPASAFLLASGLAGPGWLARRRSKRAA